MNSHRSSRWHAYPMGPKLREWLGISAPDYLGSTADEPKAEEKIAFSEFVIAYAQEQAITSSSQLVELLDELLSMALPLVVLKLADMHQLIWDRQDFRGVQAEGLAAMMTGELARAELCFRQAQQLAPEEPAPYVNLVQIMQHDGRWSEA